MAMDKEREALVETPWCVAELESLRRRLIAELSSAEHSALCTAIAALTAQQEPVAWVYLWPGQPEPEFHRERLGDSARSARQSQGVIERPLVYGDTGSPSGVREEDDIDAHNKDWFETLARAEAITRAAEQVNAEGQRQNCGHCPGDKFGHEYDCQAPDCIPQPADGVVVSQFNMMNGPSIPWSLGEALYAGYVAIGNGGQSIGTLNERGGFGWAEVAYMWAEHPRREKFKAAVKSALLAAAKEQK